MQEGRQRQRQPQKQREQPQPQLFLFQTQEEEKVYEVDDDNDDDTTTKEADSIFSSSSLVLDLTPQQELKWDTVRESIKLALTNRKGIRFCQPSASSSLMVPACDYEEEEEEEEHPNKNTTTNSTFPHYSPPRAHAVTFDDSILDDDDDDDDDESSSFSLLSGVVSSPPPPPPQHAAGGAIPFQLGDLWNSVVDHVKKSILQHQQHEDSCSCSRQQQVPLNEDKNQMVKDHEGLWIQSSGDNNGDHNAVQAYDQENEDHEMVEYVIVVEDYVLVPPSLTKQVLQTMPQVAVALTLLLILYQLLVHICGLQVALTITTTP